MDNHCWLPTARTQTGADWRIRSYLRKSFAERPDAILFGGFRGQECFQTVTPDRDTYEARMMSG
jgi:hypothetical protein